LRNTVPEPLTSSPKDLREPPPQDSRNGLSTGEPRGPGHTALIRAPINHDPFPVFPSAVLLSLCPAACHQAVYTTSLSLSVFVSLPSDTYVFPYLHVAQVSYAPPVTYWFVQVLTVSGSGLFASKLPCKVKIKCKIVPVLN
jgi:hypothetical protein